MNAKPLVLLVGLPLVAQTPDFGKLPDWAAVHALAASRETAPADADAWVLLQKTEFAYTGSGEIVKRTFRLVRVLEERGISERVFAVHGLGGEASRVKKIKGWNLRPDGELEKLDSDRVITLPLQQADVAFSTDTLTSALLSRVVKGSLVAFESEELIKSPMGPYGFALVLERHPIRQWECALAKKGGWFTSLKHVQLRFEPRNLAAWSGTASVGAEGVVLTQVPARPKDERLHPALLEVEPSIWVAFLDPAYKDGVDATAWDGIAQWISRTYAGRFHALEPLPLAGLDARAGLEAMSRWLSRNLQYKAVYVTPERGFVPETSEEVARRRYGDCKDLACCLAGGVLALGLSPHPVLANIGNAKALPAHQPTPYAFNHVILAIGLKESLGLPAEVETPAGRFLLVDPTARLTPLGWLSAGHRGRSVMICLPERALWVQVPDRAIERGRLDTTVRGAFQGKDLHATLILKETAGHSGLRQAALLGDPRLLNDRVRAVLALPAEASLEVVRASDALDSQGTWDLEVRIVYPRALQSHWGEFQVPAFGMADLPPLAQKSGVPRRYPVEQASQDVLDVHLDLALPPGLAPRLGDRSLATAFRKVAWKARVEGGRLRADYHAEDVPAYFGFAQREEGVKAARADRSQVKLLMDDATALVPVKPKP